MSIALIGYRSLKKKKSVETPKAVCILPGIRVSGGRTELCFSDPLLSRTQWLCFQPPRGLGSSQQYITTLQLLPMNLSVVCSVKHRSTCVESRSVSLDAAELGAEGLSSTHPAGVELGSPCRPQPPGPCPPQTSGSLTLSPRAPRSPPAGSLPLNPTPHCSVWCMVFK